VSLIPSAVKRSIDPDGTDIAMFHDEVTGKDVQAVALVDDLGGQVQYTTQSGGIDTAGPWRVQVIVTTPTGVFHSGLGCFTVDCNL
jgi:hypothetical protein